MTSSIVYEVQDVGKVRCVSWVGIWKPKWRHGNRLFLLHNYTFKTILRIDNRRQSDVCATLGLPHSLAVPCTMSYHIPQESLFVCLPSRTKMVMITRNYYFQTIYFIFYFF